MKLIEKVPSQANLVLKPRLMAQFIIHYGIIPSQNILTEMYWKQCKPKPSKTT